MITRLVDSGELQAPLTVSLEAAIDILNADFGIIQLFDERAQVLRIVVQRGLQKRFLDYFAEVDATNESACGKALADNRTVLVEDVENEPAYAQRLEEARAAGYRAVLSAPLVASAGRIVGMLSVHYRQPRHYSKHDLRLVEICQRQAANAINAHLLQQELRESEGRLRKVLETNGVGVLFFDNEGTLIDANDAFLQISGYSRQRVETRRLSLRGMTPPEWVEATERQCRSLERTGSFGPYEKQYLLEDGSRRWMMLTGRRIEKNLVVCYCIDIHDRKRLEEELQQAKAEAERAGDSKSRFFAAASHDLRQPFQAMRLFFEVVEQQGAPSQRHALDKLGQSMQTAEDMLDDLLDVARLEVGIPKYTPTNIDIAVLIDDLIDDLRDTAMQKGLGLKAYAPSVLVYTDPSVLKRILFNLVGNALKYTEKGGVLVGVRRRPGRLLVEIWDTGIGIEDDQRHLIFDDFYQIQNQSRDRTKGVGLGLAIVKRLCHTLRSEVCFASRLGKGSVFRVAIPIGISGAIQ